MTVGHRQDSSLILGGFGGDNARRARLEYGGNATSGPFPDILLSGDDQTMVGEEFDRWIRIG